MNIIIFNKKKLIFIIISFTLIILIGFLLIFVPLRYPLKFKKEINYVGEKYDINPEIIAGVVFAESSFNENSVSNKGALGLMQIMPDTAVWLTGKMNVPYDENMLFNPLYNLELGTYYISYLKEKFESINTVLAAFNAGEGNVAQWLKNQQYSQNGKDLITTPFMQTNYYLDKVNKAIKHYSTQFL